MRFRLDKQENLSPRRKAMACCFLMIDAYRHDQADVFSPFLPAHLLYFLKLFALASAMFWRSTTQHKPGLE